MRFRWTPSTRAVPDATPAGDRARGVATRMRSESTVRAPGLGRGLALALLVAGVASAACSGKGGSAPNAQSPERQSDTEYDLARDFFQKGQPRVALDHAQKAIALNEDNDKAHYLIAAIHLSFCTSSRGFEAPDCRLGEAEKEARAALKANAQFRDATNLLGQILINERKYKEAIALLEPLTRDPAYVHPHFAWGNLGWAQVQDGQIDAGIASLKNAVTEPRFCVGHYRLGLAYEKKGDLAGAEAALTTALGVPDPQCENLQDGWEARGRVRLRLGKQADAKSDYERCRDISQETATGKACIKQLGALGSSTPASPQAPGSSAPRAPQAPGAGGSQATPTPPNEARTT